MKYFNVGKVVNTHGIRGELKIVPQTDFPDIRFEKGSVLHIFFPDGSPSQPVIVASARYQKGTYIVKFEQLNHINDVLRFKGGMLKVTSEQLVDLAEGEYYYHEIIDCAVFNEEGQSLGIVKEILSPGANDVWVVRHPNGKEWYLPVIDEVVKDIDVTHKRIRIVEMEGLLDV